MDGPVLPKNGPVLPPTKDGPVLRKTKDGPVLPARAPVAPCSRAPRVAPCSRTCSRRVLPHTTTGSTAEAACSRVRDSPPDAAGTAYSFAR